MELPWCPFWWREIAHVVPRFDLAESKALEGLEQRDQCFDDLDDRRVCLPVDGPERDRPVVVESWLGRPRPQSSMGRRCCRASRRCESRSSTSSYCARSGLTTRCSTSSGGRKAELAR